MKIKKINTKNNSFEVDVKRFYIPFVLEGNCKNCKKNLKVSLFNEDYLSYPVVGKPFEYSLYCDECDTETDFSLQLDISLKVVDK